MLSKGADGFMYKVVLDYINAHQSVYIDTFDIQSSIQIHSFYNYPDFADVIKRLVEDNVLAPVVSSGKSHHNKERQLFKRYRKVKVQEVVSKAYKKEILTMYHPKMKVSFYIQQPEQYSEDRPLLLIINNFLMSDLKDWLTLNERSFQLFQDEKWLAKKGVYLLKKVGLTLNDLRCFQVFEPFFYYTTPGWEGSSQSNVLIVENKDTYGSFKELFKEGLTNYFGVKFDMLVYGEGEKIISSIESFWDVSGTASKDIQGYYFGDIDPVGIEICVSLMRRNEIPVIPMTGLYDELLSIYTNKRLKRGKKQTFKVDVAEKFSTYVSVPLRGEFFEVIKEHYLPQEGLNKSILRAIAERK